MKNILLLLAFAAAAVAQQPAAKPAEPTPETTPVVKPIEQSVALLLQNATLRMELLKTQFAAINSSRTQVVSALCKEQGFDLLTCTVNENEATISGKPAPPEKPPAKK